MREITEAEKGEIFTAAGAGPTVRLVAHGLMGFVFDELTRRGFKIVKEEEGK